MLLENLNGNDTRLILRNTDQGYLSPASSFILTYANFLLALASHLADREQSSHPVLGKRANSPKHRIV